jgi:hypothetical protein
MSIKTYEFTVVVRTDTPAHARQVIAERCGYDEQLEDEDGVEFDYTINYKPLGLRPYWFTVRAEQLGDYRHLHLPGEWAAFAEYVGDPEEDVEALAERLDDTDYNQPIYTEEGTEYMKRYTKLQSGTV